MADCCDWIFAELELIFGVFFIYVLIVACFRIPLWLKIGIMDLCLTFLNICDIIKSIS